MSCEFLTIPDLSSKLKLSFETIRLLIKRYDIYPTVINNRVTYSRYMKDKIIKSLPVVPIPNNSKKLYFEFSKITLESKMNNYE